MKHVPQKGRISDERRKLYFCKIIAGEIPSNTIYEDEEFKVILDASPASKGHALILPKEHYHDIYDIEEETAAHAMKLLRKNWHAI